MQRMKWWFCSACLFLTLSSCLENKPVGNESDEAVSFLQLQTELYKATSSSTPEQMQAQDFVYYTESARFFTGEFQTVGYKTHQLLEKNESQITQQDGTQVPLYAYRFLESVYKVDTEGQAHLDTQKEMPCRYARTPYSQWLESCDLTGFQDYYVYYLYSDKELPYFYNLKKRTLQTQLPQQMVQNSNCYGKENCIVNVTELEFDIIFKNESDRKRQHILLWLTKDLPYLASNIKKCISTLVEVEGKKYPYDFCQDLVNFTSTSN